MIAFRESKPMVPQIAEVVSIMRQLTNIRFPITDQLLTSTVRVKLLESWDTLKTILANMGGKNQMSKSVISQILAEEQCHIQAAGGDTSAYFTWSTGKGKKKQNNRKKCSYCKHKGHNVSECCTVKQEQEEKASSLNTKSADASTSGKSPSKSLSNLSFMKVANVNTNSDLDSDKTI
jgi:hypothetical protein